MAPTLVPPTRSSAGSSCDRLNVAALRERPISFLRDIDYSMLTEEALVLSDLVESTRLDQVREQQLFRQMNLAFYQAAQLRDELDRVAAVPAEWEELQRLLRRGLTIRNRLMMVYHKLTLAIARSFVSRRVTWDELCSEGQATLIYAISKFNPDRGFRFSTYATHSIRRGLARYVHQQYRRGEVSLDGEGLPVVESGRWTFSYERRVERTMQQLETLLRDLAPRERYVIRARFGWGREFEPRTLQQIADEFGVSRERIRQLELRALRKLRSWAQDRGLEI
jgi:RNA polymerase sigma factor (sigma-70 family)